MKRVCVVFSGLDSRTQCLGQEWEIEFRPCMPQETSGYVALFLHGGQPDVKEWFENYCRDASCLFRVVIIGRNQTRYGWVPSDQNWFGAALGPHDVEYLPWRGALEGWMPEFGAAELAKRLRQTTYNAAAFIMDLQAALRAQDWQKAQQCLRKQYKDDRRSTTLLEVRFRHGENVAKAAESLIANGFQKADADGFLKLVREQPR